MNSRERVLAALHHREPDRIPFDLGSTKVTGITRNAYLGLARLLGEDPGTFEFFDTTQQLAVMEEGILQRLEVDTRGLMPNVARKAPRITEDGQGARTFTDEWGMTWKMPQGGLYFDLVESPLAGDITVRDVEAFSWPDPAADALVEGLKEQATRWHREGYAIILESFCAGIFEMSCRVRGYEQFYMDLALDPKLACALLDKFVELKIAFYERAAQELGGLVQFVREGDDVAGEESLLMSPDSYRTYIKPRHAELFKAQRALFPEPFYVFLHSDGAIYDLLPDFIEEGVDILNPVQVTAKGMSVGRLKREFGRELVFWGGAVDPHDFAHASPDAVGQEVKRRVEDLSPGGGYIFGAIHNIQDDVPPENIVAMWEAFQEMRER
jgi:uroporphyrinogen decarboxylase